MPRETTTHIYIADSAGPQSAAEARMHAAGFMRITEADPESVFGALVDNRDAIASGVPVEEMNADDRNKAILTRVSGLLALTGDGRDIEFDQETEDAMFQDPEIIQLGAEAQAAQGRADFSPLRRRATVGALAFYAARVAEQNPVAPQHEVA